MSLQGLNVQVVCENVTSVPMNVTLRHDTVDGDTFATLADITGSCDEHNSQLWAVPFSPGGVTVMDCAQPSNDSNYNNHTFYLQTLEPTHTVILGNLSCNITASITNQKLLGFWTDVGDVGGWFNISSDETVIDNQVPAYDVGQESVGNMADMINNLQTSAGNFFVDTYQSAVIPLRDFVEVNSTQTRSIEDIADMLAGIIQYYVSAC